MSEPGPRATIVVPTFDGAASLPRTLAALGGQDYPHPYEILVVDDGSHDSTPAVLEEWRQRLSPVLRVFRQPNSGPARARNRGAAEARGRFLAFIDDDCIAEPSWLREVDTALESAGTAAVAGAVINRESSWVGRYINREAVIAHVVEQGGTVSELITGNATVRSDVFRALGGFDESIRVAGGEDTEFALRLRACGHSIAYAPRARVHHESHVTLASYLRMIYRHGRGRRRLGSRFSQYRLSVPHVRILWLLWPVRTWMFRDWGRYRRVGVPAGEAARYLLLRYLENVVRVAGYLRGT